MAVAISRIWHTEFPTNLLNRMTALDDEKISRGKQTIHHPYFYLSLLR